MTDPYTLHTLENGLRIVIELMPDVRSAAAGFLVKTGARDETTDVAGVSHFLEHMMFKGTAKRNWREITVDFDAMGSSYNAYTSEDRTVYFGWVRRGDIVRQMELLADMIRSTLPSDEFDTEKKVVLEEIAMGKDNLEHMAFDFIQEKVFAGHPLSWPVLGYEHTLHKLTRARMWKYFDERYTPDNMILIVAGKVDPKEIIATAEELCGTWKAGAGPVQRTVPPINTGVDVLQLERFKQQILCLTYASVSAADPLAETATAAATILGDDNSRFYWNIIQAGISPQAGAHHFEFTDCGLMLLYGAGPPENSEKLLEAIRSEAKLICSEPVKVDEVDHVKNRRRTTLAVESESPYHRLTQLMDDMAYRGAPRTVQLMLADVDAVSANTIQDYFSRYPIVGDGHLASAGPRLWPDTN